MKSILNISRFEIKGYENYLYPNAFFGLKYLYDEILRNIKGKEAIKVFVKFGGVEKKKGRSHQHQDAERNDCYYSRKQRT